MTFAFLGWSFYTLTGGADYQPHAGSRQAEALKARAAAEIQVAQAAADAEKAAADNANAVTRNLIDLTKIEEIGAVLDLSPSPLLQDTADAQIIEASYDDKRIGNLSLAKPASFAQAAGTPPESIDAMTEPPQDLRDLRRIIGKSVNMRTGLGTSFGVLARVTRDTEVEVLESFEDGWLRLRVLDTNRVGWIESRILSSAADRG